LGTIASFHIDGATGACIVLIQTAFFVLAFLFAPKRGILTRSIRPRESGDADVLPGFPPSRE
ncbi:MAG: metal ABC transporter permease, partial [Pseudorhodoplanes sp.]